MAAHQVAFTIWTLLALALDAIAIAGQAIVGRSLGAGDVAGARAATRRMIAVGGRSGVLLGGARLALRAAFVPLFTDDPAVRALLVDGAAWSRRCSSRSAGWCSSSTAC